MGKKLPITPPPPPSPTPLALATPILLGARVITPPPSTHTPTTSPSSWRMNQGNVAPGFWEQAVTWKCARSDFLAVVPLHPLLAPAPPSRTPPVPQPALLKPHGNVTLTRMLSFKFKKKKKKPIKRTIYFYLSSLFTSLFNFQRKPVSRASLAAPRRSYSWHRRLTDGRFRANKLADQDEEGVCLPRSPFKYIYNIPPPPHFHICGCESLGSRLGGESFVCRECLFCAAAVTTRVCVRIKGLQQKKLQIETRGF